jgi:hypothetical protein
LRRLAAAAVLAWGGAAGAVDRIALELGTIEGPGWRAAGVRLVLRAGPGGALAPELQVARLEPPAPLPVLTGLRLACPTLELERMAYRCAGATLSLEGAAGGNGSLEARALSLSGDVRLVRGAEKRLWLDVRIDGGQIYVAPVYAEVGGQPWSLRVEAVREGSGVRLERAELTQPGVLGLTGRMELGAGLAPRAAQLAFTVDDLDRAYPVFLQPFLRGAALGDLGASGRAHGSVQWRAGGTAHLALGLDGATVRDRQGRFAVQDLAGELAWPVATGRLRWAGAHVYGLPLGGASLDLVQRDGQPRLATALELDFLDGRLRIEELALPGAHGSGARLAAVLTPVSMERVSQVLGWPAMGGTLSGMIPRVILQDGQVRLDGALLLRVFDGEVVVRDLALDQVFGEQPRLAAQVDVRGLSLEPLTRAFSFGTMRGRLDGRVHDLELVGWRPVAFDARLYTPPDDTSERRISQRAVASLASLGGASGALSRTFLSLFQEFGYERLGLGCRLQAGVCSMSGVLPAEAGYYIVKGGGVPRIDVIGHNPQVDWDTLVERLRAATGATPVVR